MWGDYRNRAGLARGLALAAIAASSALVAPGAAQAAATDGVSSAPPLYVRVETSPPPYVTRDDAGADDVKTAMEAPAGMDAPNDAAATPVFVVHDGAASAMGRMPEAGLFASTSYERALDCMTMAIAYEAGQEPTAGKEAVGQVILNRVRASRFPKSVCGVVFEGSARTTGCQFTFTCDGSMRRRLMDATLQSARLVAQSVLAGVAPDRVSGATHYHANYILPYWAASGARVARIGAHIFYRMPGDVGGPGAAVALANEPDPAALRAYPLGRREGPTTLARLSSTDAPRAMFAPWGLAISNQR